MDMQILLPVLTRFLKLLIRPHLMPFLLLVTSPGLLGSQLHVRVSLPWFSSVLWDRNTAVPSCANSFCEIRKNMVKIVAALFGYLLR